MILISQIEESFFLQMARKWDGYEYMRGTLRMPRGAPRFAKACIRELRIVCEDCMMGYYHWHMCNMKYCDSWEYQSGDRRYSTADIVRASAWSPYMDRLDWEKKRKRRSRKRVKKHRRKRDMYRWIYEEGYEPIVKECESEWNKDWKRCVIRYIYSLCVYPSVCRLHDLYCSKRPGTSNLINFSGTIVIIILRRGVTRLPMSTATEKMSYC